MCLVGTPPSLEVIINDPSQYVIKELLTNLVATTAAIVLSSNLMPSLISVKNGRWAAIASMPIAFFITAIGLMAAVPSLA
jgi:hypothetical protein